MSSRNLQSYRAFERVDPVVEDRPLVVLTCRPHEFKLLRDSLTDRASFPQTYTEYLEETIQTLTEARKDPNLTLIRGTWDIIDFLTWCDETKCRPRKMARKLYFEEYGSKLQTGEVKEPQIMASASFDDMATRLIRKCSTCQAPEPTPKSFNVCSKCRCACYCGPEHQRADWQAHKKWCSTVT